MRLINYFPVTIAKRGAEHLANHNPALESLVAGASAVASSGDGPGILAELASDPKGAGGAQRLFDDSLFGEALDAVRADQLLRTVFVGFGGGVQPGVVGGGGAAGIGFDLLDPSHRGPLGFWDFELGIGVRASGGLVVGALTAEPGAIRGGTCTWSFGATLAAIGVYVKVIMRNKDLSLMGVTANLAGGVGMSTTTGYGSIQG